MAFLALGSSLQQVEVEQGFIDSRADLSLAKVALHAGFTDQSQFSRHFKRLVGVTPREFRTPARIA